MSERTVDGYTVMADWDLAGLIKKVQDFINQEWQPLGSLVVFMSDTGRPCFAQAMVRYE